MPIILDSAQLNTVGVEHAHEYQSGDPFPHIVIDDLLPEPVLRELIDAFPGPEDAVWAQHNNQREVKLALRDEKMMPEPHLQVMRELNGQAFIRFLEAMTGIEGLVPDPHYYGGGLHQILPGGLLKVHADFNLHPVTHLQRRLNVLLYLNEDWDESYGGHIELWDTNMTRPVKRVLPTAGKMLVFSTTSNSYHGHPDPLSCPPGRFRRSMAWYYYTLPARHVTRHSTLFQARPGERVYTTEEVRKARKAQLAQKGRSLVPSWLKSGVRSVRH